MIWLLLFACSSTEKETNVQEDVVDQDLDGDGYDDSEDCNDNDPQSYPGSEEICDGIDNNCDGEVDEGVLSTFYLDADGDGFGNADITMDSCEVLDGYVSTGGDCDDASDLSYPGAEEICDGLDNNCDEEIDEG
ncbi:MAG: putative metal-binding motif-containing protein, partial [Myxococcota bacterium]|nr:putative metal-binding motif-containing protein [Myxococcota bacterium]